MKPKKKKQFIIKFVSTNLIQLNYKYHIATTDLSNIVKELTPVNGIKVVINSTNKNAIEMQCRKSSIDTNVLNIDCILYIGSKRFKFSCCNNLFTKYTGIELDYGQSTLVNIKLYKLK